MHKELHYHNLWETTAIHVRHQTALGCHQKGSELALCVTPLHRFLRTGVIPVSLGSSQLCCS